MNSPPAGGKRQIITMPRCLVAVAALFAFDGTAAAATITFEGDYGLNRQQPGVAEDYDATGATVRVEQGTSNSCWNLRGSGSGSVVSTFTGGRCIGHNRNRFWDRKPLYDRGNGAALRSEIRRFTLRQFYTEYAWDPLKAAVPNAEHTYEEVWVEGGRDDCIEADQHPNRITVRRSMILNCHSLISVTPGKSQPLAHPALVEFEDSVLSVGCMLDDNAPCLKRATRANYPWSRKYSGNMDPGFKGGTGGRSGSQVFKVRGFGTNAGGGNGITVRFKNNHFAAGATPAAPGPDGVFWTADDVLQENGFHTPKSNLRFFQDMTVTADSTGNTFYWLGGCDYKGLTMVQLHGACVPKEFNLDPKVWTAASNSWDDWLAARNRFIAVTWEGGEPPAPGPGPTPDPAPEPDPGHDPDPGPDPTPDPAPGPKPADKVAVALDMRPQQCPNQARLHRTGTMPVAIAGTDSVNVRDIDPESIRLAGVAPQLQRTQYQDLVTPFEPFVGKRDKKDCTRDGADGFEDMLLRFSVPELSKALGSLPNKAVVVVRLTGKLEDGTPIEGEDVIVVNN